MIAQSFERIHRSNLVGMGVLPLVLEEGTSWQTLGLKGDEKVTHPRHRRPAAAAGATRRSPSPTGARFDVPVLVRIDTLDELEYFRNGGILHYVLRNLVKQAA